MYLSGIFISEFYYEDFTKELEKMRVEIVRKSTNLSIKQIFNTFKSKLSEFSDDKIKNLFFYYYVAFNTLLGTFEKTHVNLKLEKAFKCEKFNPNISLENYNDRRLDEKSI